MKLLDNISDIINSVDGVISILKFIMLLVAVLPVIYWIYKKNIIIKLKVFFNKNTNIFIIDVIKYILKKLKKFFTTYIVIYVQQPILNPILKVNKGHYAGAKLPITNSRLVIGRDAKYCQLVLPDNSNNVSRRHCIVHFNRQENVFMLEDCGSRNGTYVNGRTKLTEGEVFRLKAGDSFSLGLAGDVFEVGFEQSLPLTAI